jgi:acyl CoA:acetate/3-ketoacid CoA transferase beta subunit
MLHTTKEGEPRLVRECAFPLTAKKCVSLIVTDLAVIEVTKEGFVLKEIAPGWTVPEVQSLTAAELLPSAHLKEIEL